MSTPGAPWSWVDATFMASPALALASNLTQNQSYADAAYFFFNQTAVGQYALWDETEGLFWRDDTYIGKVCPNNQTVKWSRGNGWAFAALARTLEYTPLNWQFRPQLVSYFQQMAASLRILQGADGLWRSSLLDYDEFPNPETSGTGLFTAGFAYGVRAGILDAAAYAPTVWRAWQGLSTVSLQPNGLVGWCQPEAAAPGPATQDGTADFCVGAFLLAGAEVIRLVRGTQ